MVRYCIINQSCLRTGGSGGSSFSSKREFIRTSSSGQKNRFDGSIPEEEDEGAERAGALMSVPAYLAGGIMYGPMYITGMYIGST
jgi:hypothetical protein